MSDVCCSQSPTFLARPRALLPIVSLFALWGTLSIWPTITLAEVRIVTAQGEHRMGDRDTKEDAIRLATEAAKRQALEEVAVYLESTTIVKGLDVTKDEIRTYTAGLVLVLEQHTDLQLDGDGILVKTDLVAQIDTEDVGHAIKALRENEDAKHQLVALRQENDQLQQNLDAANQALAKASTPEQTQQAAQQRQDLFNRAQSNAMVSQAWTDWVLASPTTPSYPLGGQSQTQALLSLARSLYPSSQHVQAAQQVMTARQPSSPPQPPAPPVPGMRPSTMPSYQLVPHQSEPGPIPLRLNEITYRTLQSRQQLLPRQSQARQPPITRRLPPTNNYIHPPAPRQAPRAPSQVAPHMRGTGGQHSSGGSNYRSGGGRER